MSSLGPHLSNCQLLKRNGPAVQAQGPVTGVQKEWLEFSSSPLPAGPSGWKPIPHRPGPESHPPWSCERRGWGAHIFKQLLGCSWGGGRSCCHRAAPTTTVTPRPVWGQADSHSRARAAAGRCPVPPTPAHTPMLPRRGTPGGWVEREREEAPSSTLAAPSHPALAAGCPFPLPALLQLHSWHSPETPSLLPLMRRGRAMWGRGTGHKVLEPNSPQLASASWDLTCCSGSSGSGNLHATTTAPTKPTPEQSQHILSSIHVVWL